MHEIRKFFWPKVFFWSIKKVPFRKNIHNMSQGPPNPGFMQEKVQKGDFLKKPSRELIFFCCFRFLWISWRPGTLKWKWLVFLLSKILYKKCDMFASVCLSVYANPTGQWFVSPRNPCRFSSKRIKCILLGGTSHRLLNNFSSLNHNELK